MEVRKIMKESEGSDTYSEEEKDSSIFTRDKWHEVAHVIFFEGISERFDARSNATLRNRSHDDESHGIVENACFRGDD